MIDLVKRIIGADVDSAERIPDDDSHRHPHHDVHLATYVVFLEMAHIDNEFSDTERKNILAAFQDEYGLSREDVVDLKKASREMRDESLDVWKFTNVINQHYSREEKSRIVELLWRLVYADGKMDEHENYFMHKLSKLLNLTHRDLIDAKLRVLRGRDGSAE
jgi:uncharacterized tellurite resistance protein B-like protein